MHAIGNAGQACTLETLLATYPNTAALKAGSLPSETVRFAFADVPQAHLAFKAVVREARYDVGELAIVTALQAHAAKVPYVLLPVVIVGRSQHRHLVYDSSRARPDPARLAGLRIGVRAYSQTTGVWLRGMLAEEYGLDFREVRWVTFEEAHIRGYRDPAWVERAPQGADMLSMLRAGELDAAIVGNVVPAEPLRPLIPDAEVAGAAWSRRHGFTPINHMLVVRTSLSATQPAVVREVCRLLRESRERARTAGACVDDLPIGVEANRQALDWLIGESVRQEILSHPCAVDELFDATTRTLVG
jgi:4,5-dihydroxyphthalate decarboxylase